MAPTMSTTGYIGTTHQRGEQRGRGLKLVRLGSDRRRCNSTSGNLRGGAGGEGGSLEILSWQEGRDSFRRFRPPARILFQALQDCPFQGRLNFGTQQRRWNQLCGGLEAVGRYAVKGFPSRGQFIQHNPQRIEVAFSHPGGGVDGVAWARPHGLATGRRVVLGAFGGSCWSRAETAERRAAQK